MYYESEVARMDEEADPLADHDMNLQKLATADLLGTRRCLRSAHVLTRGPVASARASEGMPTRPTAHRGSGMPAAANDSAVSSGWKKAEE